MDTKKKVQEQKQTKKQSKKKMSWLERLQEMGLLRIVDEDELEKRLEIYEWMENQGNPTSKTEDE